MSFNLGSGEHSTAPTQRRGKFHCERVSVTCLALMLWLPAIAIAATPAGNRTLSATSTANVITFSPSAVTLNNPATPSLTTSPAGPISFVVTLTVYDSKGNILLPTEDHPLHVHVYGAPDGVISPVDRVITSGTTTTYTSVSFTYSGGYFPNNMELAAWMKDPTAGESLGTTLFVQGHRPSCTYGAKAFPAEMISTVPDAIKVKSVVGADNPQQSDFMTFTIDTGSLGVIVTKSDLVMGANVHGPGAPGEKFYDSSGFEFTGSYYLAPVSIELTDHTFVQTDPILVLAIDHVKCHKGYQNCKTPGKADLHYLGVGFDRNKTGPGDLFDSPAENAFLRLADPQNGTDINQGYQLSTLGVTLGLTAENSTGFNTVTLDANTSVPGDWNPVHGCFQFTTLAGSPQFCGNLLLDVGISEMFLDLASDQRPEGSFDPTNRVPPRRGMRIQAGPDNDPAMHYDFVTVQPPQQPTGPAPTYAKWINDDNVFVNTGRRALLEYNYMFSGQCGLVGYQHTGK